MRDGADSQTGWKALYEAAVLELDESSLPQRIFEAQHAIMDRIEDLNHSGDDIERQELSNALTVLRDLSRINNVRPPEAA